MKPFWTALADRGDAPAVIEAADGRTTSYAQLAAEADARAAALGLTSRGLVFLFARNDRATLATYLGALRAGHVVALLPAGPAADALVAAYAPDRICAPADAPAFAGYTPRAISDLACWQPATPATPPPLHPDLALLLSTSGSTGSPKLVRLSAASLVANAESIGDYLALGPAERAPTTLPLSYSYGLSVVHSHLAAGAALVLGDFPVVQRETWDALTRHAATSFAGVPLSYQLLRRLRFDPRRHPSLRTYTQAGGRLDEETKRWLLDAATAAGARCFVMYGQTEATARISYVPPELLPVKLDSIGRAIPGGELTLDPANGEILYRGPNVMLGYAQARADLALGDVQHGLLRTGDLGRVDADGCFTVTGRLKRFLKLAGVRVSLDELERGLEQALGGAVACGGGDEALQVRTELDLPVARIHAVLQERFGIAPALAQVRAGVALARLPSGKIDYAALGHG